PRKNSPRHPPMPSARPRVMVLVFMDCVLFSSAARSRGVLSFGFPSGLMSGRLHRVAVHYAADSRGFQIIAENRMN
ncbi:MAG TPA: hypothetical protein VLO11_13370, partial [Luteolibacter sp.]|nr:hypothetical protein [Luteolibacter sp.]